MNLEANLQASTPTTPRVGVKLTASSGGVYLPDGNYRGMVTDIVSRAEASKETGEVYDYIDFAITEAVSKETITVGFPARLTPRSDLGALFTAFGLMTPTPGTEVDLDAIFLGREVVFMARNETNQHGTFTRVVKGSVRPAA